MRASLPRTLPFALSLSMLAAGCGDGAPSQPTVDYYHDTSAVFSRYCTTCHSDGGVAPFSLTTYESTQRYASLIRGAVESGSMPPWLPSDASVPLRYSRAMRAEDKKLLLDWLDAGGPAGDPSSTPRTDIPPAETVVPPKVNMTLDFGFAYTPDAKKSDDYHCFVYDPKLANDTFVYAGDVIPGNKQIVHHVLMFEILAADAASVTAKNPTGQGYTCFGGPGTSGRPTTLFGWVPGSVPMRAPEGTALRIHKGSLIVMQVHYNNTVVKGQPDRTTAVLETSDVAPTKELAVLPLAQLALTIPAGDPSAKASISLPLSAIQSLFKLPRVDSIIYSAAPHMHLLGKTITTSVAGKKLVEIPRCHHPARFSVEKIS